MWECMGTKFAIYLLASFTMVVLALYRILPVNYLGEIVIVLFISGLIYAWLNAWRQTDKLIAKAEISERSDATQRPVPNESTKSRRMEEPIVS